MPNPEVLHELIGKVLGNFAGAMSAILMRIGEEQGLFKALAEGPATSAELAKRTDLAERYVREWLSAMAASGYINYAPESQVFSMTEEQVAVFAIEGTPAYMPSFSDMLVALVHDYPKISAEFKTGKGVAWGDHHQCLFRGTERFFRPGYAAFLVEQWIPALDGVKTKLEKGAKVADIGCGRGSSTLIMAKAFPNSTFVGYDFHPPSIELARAHAKEEGLSNATFEVAAAKTFDGGPFDLVTIFDALHDMGDPAGAAAHVKSQMKPDGTWMVVEPLAGDRLEENFHPLGQLFYSASTLVCTPASLAQEVGLALGAQAGQARLTKVLNDGGFSKVRRAAETPTNMILEARI